MKYLCLIYQDEKVWESMSEAQVGAIIAEHAAFGKEVGASGKLLGGEALQPTNAATTIRSRNGKISTTDGPFAETKEQLGGYYLIEAKDLNEAIQIASKIPEARHDGCVEVRPIMDYGNM